MNKLLVLCIFLGLTSLSYAGNDKGKSDSAAQGTKVLMERIAALEAAVGYLVDTSNEVSGGSYLMTSRGSQLFVNNVAPVQGGSHSLGKVIYDFFADGTGVTFVLSCNGRRVIDMDFNNEDTSIMESATLCQTQDVSFTYMQDGDQLSIQFAAFPVPFDYFVSDDGSMLVAANGGASGIAPCVGDNAPDGCTVTVSTVVVNQGIRIGNSE